MRENWDWLAQEVYALRARFGQDEYFLPPTRKQLLLLRMLTEDHLRDPEHRIPLLRAVTNLPITSSKQLTRWTVSVLIGVLLEDGGRYQLSAYGRLFLSTLEEFVEAFPCDTDREAYLEGLAASLSYLRAANF